MEPPAGQPARIGIHRAEQKTELTAHGAHRHPRPVVAPEGLAVENEGPLGARARETERIGTAVGCRFASLANARIRIGLDALHHRVHVPVARHGLPEAEVLSLLLGAHEIIAKLHRFHGLVGRLRDRRATVLRADGRHALAERRGQNTAHAPAIRNHLETMAMTPQEHLSSLCQGRGKGGVHLRQRPGSPRFGEGQDQAVGGPQQTGIVLGVARGKHQIQSGRACGDRQGQVVAVVPSFGQDRVIPALNGYGGGKQGRQWTN